MARVKTAKNGLGVARLCGMWASCATRAVCAVCLVLPSIEAFSAMCAAKLKNCTDNLQYGGT